MVARRTRQREREFGCGEEPHDAPGRHARAANRYRKMGLAPSGLAMEHKVLCLIDKLKRAQVGLAVAIREDDLREVVALEGLDLRESRTAEQAGALVALTCLQFGRYQVGHAPRLGGRGGFEE